jgi:hypothetical protein
VQVVFAILCGAAACAKKVFAKIKNRKIEKPKNRNRQKEKSKKTKIPGSLEKRERLQKLRNGEVRIVLRIRSLGPLPEAQPQATHSQKESPPSQQCPQ